MPKTTPDQNKAIVLEAFDTLFNKRDYAAAERFWSPTYIQHSAPRREGLFALIRSAPDTLHEDGLLAEPWDVLQDEATKAESVSGLPMFGDRFPS